MTVGELKEKLEKFDNDTPVFMPHWQGGFDDLKHVHQVHVAKRVPYKDYQGAYESIEEDSPNGVSLSPYDHE